MQSISIIVGLGNTGQVFLNTRHNVGFDVLDLFAYYLKISFKHEKKLHCDISYFESSDICIVLAKPITMVNESFRCVKSLIKKFNIDSEQLVVVVDDVEVDLGKVKMRFGGSHKGHNGVRGIVDNIKTQNFFRLCVGIGRPEGIVDLSPFVLGKFEHNEQIVIEESKKKSVNMLKTWVNERFSVF